MWCCPIPANRCQSGHRLGELTMTRHDKTWRDATRLTNRSHRIGSLNTGLIKHSSTGQVQTNLEFLNSVSCVCCCVEPTWSEWSPCSATCGTGVEARVFYCRPVVATPVIRLRQSSDSAATRQCPDDFLTRTETRPCTVLLNDSAKCPGVCSFMYWLWV
jgi:Thrombospondin type 1 domain